MIKQWFSGSPRRAALVTAAVMGVLSSATFSPAALQFSIDGTWDTQARKDAATNAMTAVINRFNAYGVFTRNNDGVVNVTYNSGVATADATYNGTIRFGGTYPNERVAQHELNHWLGSGTTSQWTSKFDAAGDWTGPKLAAIIKQFDGDNAVINKSGVHFYGYGLNYDTEVISTNTLPQNVAVMYAMRQDMGIGTLADPWTAKVVTAKQSNQIGRSGFNWYDTWDDGYFAHPGAAYFTGNWLIRTPLDTYTPGGATPSFTFAGDSLTINNTNGINGGLLYKGVGTTGVLTFKQLILDGGTIRHASSTNDLCQLAGGLVVRSASTIVASQGNINILADVSGNGTLTIPATDAATEDNRYVRFFSSANTFTGNIDVAGGRFQLANGANLNFVIGDNGVNNAITGSAARRVLLDGVFQIDLTNAATIDGSQWTLVSAANVVYGSTFAVAGFTESTAGLWTLASGYTFTESTGRLTYATPSAVPEPAVLGGLAAIGLLGLRRPGQRGRPGAKDK